MDYSQGTSLYKYQWDNVHDPEAMVGWLQSDEESALRSAIPVLRAIREANQNNDTQLNLTPYGNQALRSEITIKETSLRVVVLLDMKGHTENVIDPKNPTSIPATSAFGEYDGDFTRLRFLNGSDATVKITTDTKDVAILEAYLLGEALAKKIDSYDKNEGNLTKNDYEEAARELEVEVEAIMAFAKVEANGTGFLEDGRAKILFEGHRFYKNLKSANINPELKRKGNEDIIYKYSELKAMNPKPYVGGSGEYRRLEKAIAIHREAALLSASYGAFQIMGDNYAMCGFDSVENFYKAMNESEKKQLEAFILYAKNRGVIQPLKDKDWKEVARLYNGPDYAKNKYDEKFKDAYNSYKSGKNDSNKK